MPIVKAICTNCGGTLEVDNSKEAAVCKYCGQPYMVEKAINQYVSNYQIQNAKFFMGPSVDDSVQQGIEQIEMGLYEDALRTFQSITRGVPKEFRGWFGACVARGYRSGNFDDLERTNALKTCPPSVRSLIGDLLLNHPKLQETYQKEIHGYKNQIVYYEREKKDTSHRTTSGKISYSVNVTIRLLIGLFCFIFLVFGALGGFWSEQPILGWICLALLIPLIKNGIDFYKEIQAVKETQNGYSNQIVEFKQSIESYKKKIAECERLLEQSKTGRTVDEYFKILKTGHL